MVDAVGLAGSFLDSFRFDTLFFMHNENVIFPSDGGEERKETNGNQHVAD